MMRFFAESGGVERMVIQVGGMPRAVVEGIDLVTLARVDLLTLLPADSRDPAVVRQGDLALPLSWDPGSPSSNAGRNCVLGLARLLARAFLLELRPEAVAEGEALRIPLEEDHPLEPSQLSEDARKVEVRSQRLELLESKPSRILEREPQDAGARYLVDPRSRPRTADESKRVCEKPRPYASHVRGCPE